LEVGEPPDGGEEVAAIMAISGEPNSEVSESSAAARRALSPSPSAAS